MKVENKSYKVVVDTNIWISFLIGKTLQRLQRYIYHEKVSIITCREQVFELEAVLSRPKLKRYFQEAEITAFFDLLDKVSQLLEITKITPLCRDPADDYLLALAIEANADFLVTGDLDLLAVKQVKDTLIINFPHFQKIMEGGK